MLTEQKKSDGSMLHYSHTLMISNSYLIFFEVSKIIRKFASR